jgi:hypothetical protein
MRKSKGESNLLTQRASSFVTYGSGSLNLLVQRQNSTVIGTVEMTKQVHPDS